MAKKVTKRAKTGKKTGKKKAPKAAARKKPARKQARKPARKATRKAAQPAKKTARKPVRKAAKPAKRAAKKAAKKPVRKPSPAMKKPAKKAPGRKPAAPKVRGKSPIRKAVNLDRERRRLIETDENGPTAPSTLGYVGGSSAARSGSEELREALHEHTESGPALTGGDIDASWQDAYAVGDEAPGGDNPTPDQDRVDDIGRALGVQYNDNEELRSSDKIIERDRHRWELDPASSDDYRDRGRNED